MRKLRSDITREGLSRTPHRAFMRAMGLDDAAGHASATRDGRASLRHDQGPHGSNPLPNEDAAARGRRDGTARARLQSHPRHKHHRTGPSYRSNPNIGFWAETVSRCHELALGVTPRACVAAARAALFLHDQDPKATFREDRVRFPVQRGARPARRYAHPGCRYMDALRDRGRRQAALSIRPHRQFGVR
jgi:hypothetical protein